MRAPQPSDDYAPVLSMSAGAFRRRRNRAHESMMDDYYAARDAWVSAREATALGYATEEQEFAATNPAPRLRDFMRNRQKGESA